MRLLWDTNVVVAGVVFSLVRILPGIPRKPCVACAYVFVWRHHERRTSFEMCFFARFAYAGGTESTEISFIHRKVV